jgi:hypothetical protein
MPGLSKSVSSRRRRLSTGREDLGSDYVVLGRVILRALLISSFRKFPPADALPHIHSGDSEPEGMVRSLASLKETFVEAGALGFPKCLRLSR